MTVRLTRRQADSSSLISDTRDRDKIETNIDTVVIRIPLAPVGEVPGADRPAVCIQCGSMGFNVHQRIWRTVNDPHLKRINVGRYVCKRCGTTSRLIVVSGLSDRARPLNRSAPSFTALV